jgi:hypothetical protein
MARRWLAVEDSEDEEMDYSQGHGFGGSHRRRAAEREWDRLQRETNGNRGGGGGTRRSDASPNRDVERRPHSPLTEEWQDWDVSRSLRTTRTEELQQRDIINRPRYRSAEDWQDWDVAGSTSSPVHKGGGYTNTDGGGAGGGTEPANTKSNGPRGA